MATRITIPIPQDEIKESFVWRDWFQKLSNIVYGTMAEQDASAVVITGGVITSVTGIISNFDGFKNRIINGSMVNDQRNAAASQTFTATAPLAYAVDRWYGYCTGANVTGQQVAGSTTPTNTQFRYRFTGAASVATIGFGQRIEQRNSYDMAGSTCTLSADLAISATLTTVTWTAYYATTTADTFGTLASPTVTQIATGTFTVSATVTNFNTQITVPAAATTGIQILFTIGALTSGTWTIGNVQLEKGSTVTSFDYRPCGTELALCQRYYYRLNATSVTSTFSTAFAESTTVAGGNMVFPVSMRTSPSTIEPSATAGNYTIRYVATDAVCSSVPSFVSATTNGSWYRFTVAAVLTAGQAVMLRASNTSAYLGWSAEL